MSQYSDDIPGTHTVWECVYRLGMDATCSISCICMCHGYNQFPLLIRARGLHVHEWRGRIFHLVDRPDNMSIWCTECTMKVPRGSKPGIVAV